MKPLIRPFLFAVVRLGLFLAVVAWIVGQWWQMNCEYIKPGIGLQLDNSGWLLTDTVFNFVSPAKSPGWALRTTPNSEVIPSTADLLLISFQRHQSHFDAPGVFVSYGSIGNWMFIRHWCTISIFIAFNLFLHCIYRRQPAADHDRQ